NIVRLLEQYLEARTRALHPHLERRNPVARDVGHLLVAQLFDVLHQKSLALIHVELGERVLNIIERVVRRVSGRGRSRGQARVDSANDCTSPPIAAFTSSASDRSATLT